MLLVQLTDIHLMAEPDQTLRGINTQRTLAQVLEAIAQMPKQPNFFLLTGDLANDGDISAYQRLRATLTPINIPAYALMGNHDLEKNLTHHLTNHLIHYQPRIVVNGWQILCLNSTVREQIGGYLSEASLQSLKDTLADCSLPTLIALHHPPMLLGSAWIDSMGLANREAFWQVCELFPHVKLVLCGHAHQRADLWHGDIACLVSPATCMQFLPKSEQFTLDPNGLPAWRWVELNRDGSYTTGVCFC